MGLRSVVCAACGALAVGWGAMAQETVKLEYKLQPGTELIYKTSGTIKMSGKGVNVESTISGHPKFLVADVDAVTGVMLLGQLPATKITMKISTPQGDQTQEQTADAMSVCRMDRLGNSVARKVKDEGKLPPIELMMARMFDQRLLDVVPLPAAAVAAGARWENAPDTALQGIPYPMPFKAVSTLAEIKTVDGRKCAVIQSKLTPSEKEPAAGMPDMAVSGDVETLFDVDGGFSRNVKYKLDFENDQSGRTVISMVEETSVLDSVKLLPPEEAMHESKIVRAFDAAVASVYKGEYTRATDALENLKPADVPDVWKAGINKAVGYIKQIAQLAKGDAQK